MASTNPVKCGAIFKMNHPPIPEFLLWLAMITFRNHIETHQNRVRSYNESRTGMASYSPGYFHIDQGYINLQMNMLDIGLSRSEKQLTSM